MLVCGIDEAGRGPVAGPLVVAGCILHKNIDGVVDSKKLTPKKREALFEQIVKNSTYTIITTHNDMIDLVGLSQAIADSLRKIKNQIEANQYIFDGKSSFGIEGIQTMIKGDMHEQNIAAASILAKVTRDRFMLKIASNYPQYSFKSHKGYITKTHIEEIKKYGYSDIHRKSVKIKSLQQSLFD